LRCEALETAMPASTVGLATTDRSDPLDCAWPIHFAFWFALGTVIALVVMTAYAINGAGLLLHVGSENALLHQLESEVGPIQPADPIGHDGQLYYLIARDPMARRQTPAVIASLDNNGPRYRYRRILFPVLAGGFGEFGGRTTLYAMIGWLAVAMGLASVAIADLGFLMDVRGEWVLIAILNAGALASLLFLTPDMLALALGLAGVALTLRSRIVAAALVFALAALTKEVYLLVPWALAIYLWRRNRYASRALAVVPPLPLALWSSWVARVVPDVTTTVANLGTPFNGFAQAVQYWVSVESNPVEISLGAVISLTLVASIVALRIGPSSPLRAIVVAWLALGCFATVQVWGKPNNAARVFAMLWPLSILLIGQRAALAAPSRAAGTRRPAAWNRIHQ
jgi:hypothetical protein